ncbi:MAG: hypoxanthine phosphoribosyltransferase [Actinomycetota bacterium]|nr:hypoxanthine phosphoribosyltransferase [Actinomycetota bacterium]
MSDETHAPAEVLISEKDLRTRVGELGSELAALYADGPEPPLLVSVLKGSTMFLADLMRAMPIDLAVDFMSISSYGHAEHSGVVRIVKDLEENIEGRDLLIVEDIVDTGLTLNYLRRTLGDRGPRSLRAVTLLDKLARRIVPVELEFSGFEIPDVFVVGYGLDFQGLYRNTAEILAIKDLARLANERHLLVDATFGPRSHA